MEFKWRFTWSSASWWGSMMLMLLLLATAPLVVITADSAPLKAAAQVGGSAANVSVKAGASVANKSHKPVNVAAGPAFSTSGHVVKSGGDGGGKPAQPHPADTSAQSGSVPVAKPAKPVSAVDPGEKKKPAAPAEIKTPKPPKSPSLERPDNGGASKAEGKPVDEPPAVAAAGGQIPAADRAQRLRLPGDGNGTRTMGVPTHHVMAYLVGLTILLAALYIAYANRRKLLGLLIEGRGGRSTGRRTTAGSNVRYRRLSQSDPAASGDQRNYIS